LQQYSEQILRLQQENAQLREQLRQGIAREHVEQLEQQLVQARERIQQLEQEVQMLQRQLLRLLENFSELPSLYELVGQLENLVQQLAGRPPQPVLLFAPEEQRQFRQRLEHLLQRVEQLLGDTAHGQKA